MNSAAEHSGWAELVKCCGCGAELDGEMCLRLKNKTGALAGIESPICKSCAGKHFRKATPGKGIIIKPKNRQKKPFWRFW